MEGALLKVMPSFKAEIKYRLKTYACKIHFYLIDPG